MHSPIKPISIAEILVQHCLQKTDCQITGILIIVRPIVTSK